jgi:hypothetical protein
MFPIPEDLGEKPQPVVDTSDPLFDGIREYYRDFRKLPDGRYIGTLRLLYHWTIHVDIDFGGYADRYCFKNYALARAAFDAWDGTGDPDYWHNHPGSGRRRDTATGRTWLDP